ncbi:hypothetical protein FHR22_002587 [Sphingopyxis panaciterrae]|uniref:hypothetical protein n=1 Tax=Sphingopyxis panaciterrae TaxID=363841 RepID=UPI001421AFD0|nr:hypothetical protein [Sphingopyxis panaciterrae]NIJ37884.1 hypothetical protein [Sphingopyxis panaciterrae]
MGEMHDLRRSVCRHSFERNPPSQHWLESDAGTSYCWDCAVVARGREFELGPLLTISPWYSRNDWQEAFFAGIDGGDWYSAIEDGTKRCDRCGCTLHYWLTDYGLDEEIAYWRDVDFADASDTQETAYAIDRLFEVSDEGACADVRDIAQRFLAVLTNPNPDHPVSQIGREE